MIDNHLTATSQFAKFSEMHREDIKAALRKEGWTLTAAAKELGVEQSTISGILLGRRSRRIELWISRKICRPIDEVFPDRYPTPEKVA